LHDRVIAIYKPSAWTTLQNSMRNGDHRFKFEIVKDPHSQNIKRQSERRKERTAGKQRRRLSEPVLKKSN